MANLLQLKMVLDGITPSIWRRVTVDDTLTFGDLHSIIQELMNWDDDHLYEFTLGGGIKILSDHEILAEGGVLDADAVRLGAHLKKEKQKFSYVYDFGDNWEIEILVESITPKQPEDKIVCCLAGKRSGPMEDCGGVWGYADALKCLKKKEDSSLSGLPYDELVEWFGDDFDPEYFDLLEMNDKFKAFNNPKKSKK